MSRMGWLMARHLSSWRRTASSFLPRREVQRLVAQGLPQDRLHLRPGMEEPAHHRSLGDVQGLGELFVAHPLQLPQNEDLAVLLRKLAECPGDLLGQLLAQHATLRVGPQAPRDEAGVDALELPARRLVELLAVALAGPEPIDGQVAGDPVQPGIEGRIALERVQTLVHPQEGVLGDVHGLLPILDQREGDREHLSLVAKYERAESLIVPGLASAYQRKVVQLQPGTP